MSTATGRGAALAAPTETTPPAGATTSVVTLLTGDVVRLSTFPDGRQAAAVDPHGPGGRHGYQLTTRDGDTYVIPNEAVPHVLAGRVDEALFNVTDLVAAGFDDASRRTLPLLLGHRPGAAPATTLRASGGLTVRTELSSIGASAVTADKADARSIWRSLTGNSTRAAGLSLGVTKIWLDRKMRAAVTDNISAIGAPQAWAGGYDGSGVTVAVLDTGYDPTHPDLAGRVARAADFTGAGSAVDGHGHGTHVATTLAGTGAASAGHRRGVAPGARLLVGRVLDDTGAGDLSWTIAGMEWAVAQGARVVNVSIGAGISDGSDPVSAAVDSLTRSSGTLFVVAAGNAGPGESTVEAPGAAASALTVGAVAADGQVANFSARGPRTGDGLVKPEITAPGVNIVAARAAGTGEGEIVDARYTSMSGTSMATPHVAGAAALLAQQHPDWRADDLKATLVGSASPTDTTHPTATGSGRVDVAAAVRATLRADAASIGFGHVEWTGQRRPAQSTQVTYHNTARTPVTLDLAAAARAAGTPGPTAALSVSPSRVTIPAGGRATATVRLDPDATKGGAYTGQLVAGSLRIPIGFIVDGPTYAVTVSATARDGRAPGSFSQAQLWNLDTGQLHRAIIGAEPATLRVPPGRYSVMAFVFTVDGQDWAREATLLGQPQVEITGDRTLRFDARQARPLRVATPEGARVGNITMAWQRTLGQQSILTGFNLNTNATIRYSAAPTAPVTLGTFEFTTQVGLTEPQLTATIPGFEATPYHVDGSASYDGRLRASLVDGGDGSPAELARAGARGNAVLIRTTYDTDASGVLKAAADAGAALVLLRSDTDGFLFVSTEQTTMPTYVLEQSDGVLLRDRLAGGRRISFDATGVPDSPYSYQLLLGGQRAIPGDLTFDTRRMPLATVTAEFHGAGGRASDTRYGMTPSATAAYTAYQQAPTPSRRVDFLTAVAAGGPVTWRHEASADLSNWYSRATMTTLARTYRAGDRDTEVWFPAIMRPAMPATGANLPFGAPANRAADAIRVAIPQFASADAYGWQDTSIDDVRLALTRNGQPVGATTQRNAQFTVPADAATYRLDLAVARRGDNAPDWWTTSTATSSSWTFRSSRPAAGVTQVLPLLQLDYTVGTDLRNSVAAQRRHPLVIRSGYQPGANVRGPVTVRLDISYDDGRHWTRVDGGFAIAGLHVFSVPAAPKGTAFASIRATATDGHGNRLEQTIERAWAVRAP